MTLRRTLDNRIRHAAGRALLRPLAVPRVPSGRVRLEEVRRLLFVRPNFRMGNLLLTTPAFTAARAALPDAEIHLLATPAYRDLLRGHPDLDRVVTFDRGMLARPWALAGLVRTLRSARYDLVIDGSQGESLTGAILSRLSGGRWRVAPESGRYAPLFDVRVPRDPALEHRVLRLLHVLEGVGIAGPVPPMSIALDDDERAWARRRWAEWGIPEGAVTVGVNIGARDDKRWPMEEFLRVIRRLEEERGARVVVFAGPEDLDRLAAVEDRLPEDVVVDTTHEPRRFAALLARCSVVVTGDTGPMHLAAAVGAPTVSIFLKGNHEVFAPLGARHRCLHPGDGEGVEPDAVVEAASEILDRPEDRDRDRLRDDRSRG